MGRVLGLKTWEEYFRSRRAYERIRDRTGNTGLMRNLLLVLLKLLLLILVRLRRERAILQIYIYIRKAATVR